MAADLRDLADRRIFPAIDINASATRKEELLLSPEMLALSHALRSRLARLPPIDAMNELLSLMQRSEGPDDLAKQVL